MTHEKISRLGIAAVFLLTFASPLSAEWKERVLYSFRSGNDGSFPVGGIVFDQKGNLYGVTEAGGPPSCDPIGNLCGTVYRLAPPAKQGDPWTKTLLYMFKGKRYNDGEAPDGLIIDAAGNLYGVTAYGGTGDCVLVGVKAGCGTVYELSPPTNGGKWTYTELYSFKGGKDGDLPGGNLVFDRAGNLYGTTNFGGGKGTTCDPYYQYCGTVFRLSPPKTKRDKWTEEVLHSFAGGMDGTNPNGGLVLDSAGDVYGTTAGGGGTSCQGSGCGTVFRLDLPTKMGGMWTEKILHRFTGKNDGEGPSGNLIFDGKGALYGTTIIGGPGEAFGTVFRLSPRKESGSLWTETFLHVFSSCNRTVPCEPNAGVIFDSAGNLYGTATNFLFRMRPPDCKGCKWDLTVLYMFEGSPDGSAPAALIFGSTGAIYGPTGGGGTLGDGTVFRAVP